MSRGDLKTVVLLRPSHETERDVFLIVMVSEISAEYLGAGQMRTAVEQVWEGGAMGGRPAGRPEEVLSASPTLLCNGNYVHVFAAACWAGGNRRTLTRTSFSYGLGRRGGGQS